MANKDYASNTINTDVTNFNLKLSSADTDVQKALDTLDNGLVGITTVLDTYTVLVTDETVICNKATAFTVTLPTAVVGQVFTIKNIGAGLVTVDADGSDEIDGDTTQPVAQWEALKIQCNIANSWVAI